MLGAGYVVDIDVKDEWLLEVREQFSAAHALRNYNGKCERLHGHNFLVEVCVAGSDLDPETGMLLDFKILKTGLKTVLSELDHSFLNENTPFDRENPSSENIARHIYFSLAAWLEQCQDPQAGKVSMKFVKVSEKESQAAIYRPQI